MLYWLFIKLYRLKPLWNAHVYGYGCQYRHCCEIWSIYKMKDIEIWLHTKNNKGSSNSTIWRMHNLRWNYQFYSVLVIKVAKVYTLWYINETNHITQTYKIKEGMRYVHVSKKYLRRVLILKYIIKIITHSTYSCPIIYKWHACPTI